MAQSASIDFSEFIKGTDTLDEAIDKLIKLRNESKESLSEYNKQLEATEKQTKQLDTTNEAHRKELVKLASTTEQLEKAIEQIVFQTNQYAEIEEMVKQKRSQWTKAFQSQIKIVSEGAGTYEGLKAQLNLNIQTLKQYTEEQLKSDKTAQEIIQQNAELRDSLKRLDDIYKGKGIKSNTDDLEAYKKTIEGLDGSLDKIGESEEKYNENITKNSEELNKLNEINKEYGRNLEQETTKVNEKNKAQEYTVEQIKELEKIYNQQLSLTDKYNRELKAEKDELKKLQRIRDLEIKQANTQKGSYDNLSATYSLYKIELNGVGEELRKNHPYYVQLEKDAEEVYKKMNELQKATGKYQLQVGNYEIAGESARTALMKLQDQLVNLRLEGKENTDEYMRMSAAAAQLRDAYADVRAQVTAAASDTAKLNAATQSVQGLLSVLTLLNATTGNITDSTKKASAQTRILNSSIVGLQTAVKILAAGIALQNLAQKQSIVYQTAENLLRKVGITQAKAAAAAEAKFTAAKTATTLATKAATIAQAAFNAVLAVNPVFLLIGALAGLVVGFSALIDVLQTSTDEYKNAESAMQDYREEIKELRKEQNKLTSDYEALYASLDQYHRNRIADLKIQGAEEEEINRAQYEREQDLINLKIDNNDKQLELHRKELESLENVINAQQALIDSGVLTRKEQAKQIESTNSLVAAHRELIKTYRTELLLQKDLKVQLKESEANSIKTANKTAKTNASNASKAESAANKAQKEKEKQEKEAKKKADDEFKEQIKRQQSLEDARFKLMKNSREKETAELNKNYQRQIQNLKDALKLDNNLNEESKKAINEEIIVLQKVLNKELEELNNKHRTEETQREIEELNLRLSTVRENTIESNNIRLELLERQRSLELQQNASLSEDKRKDESLINKKYDVLIQKQRIEFEKSTSEKQLSIRQDYEKSVFDLKRKTEGEKTRFELRQEEERLRELYKLRKQYSKDVTDLELKTIENQIALIQKKIKKSMKEERTNDIYSLIGLRLTEEEKSAVNDSVNFILDQITIISDARVQAAERAVEVANDRVQQASDNLDREIELAKLGLANSVQTAQTELENEKAAQAKALNERQKALRAQQRLQALEQAANLITASTKIWASLGFPLALPAIAAMWASYAASQIQAKKVTAVEYGKGGFETIAGGSHASGNDTSIGVHNNKEMRVERGEGVGIFSRKAMKTYPHIKEMVNSMNKGTFPNRVLENDYINKNDLIYNQTSQNNFNTERMEKTLESIERQGQNKYTVLSDGRIYREYKGLKQIIRMN